MTKRKIISIAIIGSIVALVPISASAHNKSADKKSIDNTVSVSADDSVDPNEAENETEHGVVASATTTQVEDETAPAPTATAVNMDQAKVIAQALHPDVEIVKIEKKQKHGSIQFDFRFADGTKVEINAADGRVLSDRTKEKHVEKQDESEHKDSEHNSGHN